MLIIDCRFAVLKAHASVRSGGDHYHPVLRAGTEAARLKIPPSPDCALPAAPVSLQWPTSVDRAVGG